MIPLRSKNKTRDRRFVQSSSPVIYLMNARSGLALAVVVVMKLQQEPCFDSKPRICRVSLFVRFRIAYSSVSR